MLNRLFIVEKAKIYNIVLFWHFCFNGNGIKWKYKQFNNNFLFLQHYGNFSGNSTVAANASVCSLCFNVYNELQSEFKYQEDSEEDTGTRWCADINVSVR